MCVCVCVGVCVCVCVCLCVCLCVCRNVLPCDCLIVLVRGASVCLCEVLIITHIIVEFSALTNACGRAGVCVYIRACECVCVSACVRACA